MKQTFGATERHDQLIVYGKGQKAILIYGYGEEGGQGYDWRHEFTHMPTKQEVSQIITNHINSQVDLKILKGFQWTPEKSETINVWLSAENQRNFSEAQRMGDVPTTFKLGEDADKKPIYHTFETTEELDDFYHKAYAYIKQCLSEGWIEKDTAMAWVESIDI